MRSLSPWIDACTLSFDSLTSFCSLRARIRVDAMAQHDVLARLGEIAHRVLLLHAAHVDAAFAEPLREDVDHLLELEFRGRLEAHGHVLFLELEDRARVLEVETLRELAVRLVHGIGELVGVELGDGIE